MFIQKLKMRFSNRGRVRAAGFTLVSSVIASMISGVALLGAWTAYRNVNSQWRVAEIERQMDGYANNTLKEMTNLMGWGWSNVLLQGGDRAPRMKLYFDDRYNEEGNWRSPRMWDYNGLMASDQSIMMTYRPFRGVLLAGDDLLSAESAGYQWIGQSPNNNGLRVMTANDRMSVIGLEFSYMPLPQEAADPNGQTSRYAENRMKGLINVTMTMQYRYRGRESNGVFSGLFPESYVHERTYYSQIYMRNWDIEGNTHRLTDYPIEG